jgi:hypothetical protein
MGRTPTSIDHVECNIIFICRNDMGDYLNIMARPPINATKLWLVDLSGNSLKGSSILRVVAYLERRGDILHKIIPLQIFTFYIQLSTMRKSFTD